MTTPRILVSLTLVSLMAVQSVSAQTPTVTAHVLPTLGAPLGIATAINDHGDIIGISATAEGRLRATLWSNGAVINLGALCETCASVAYDINNAGTGVGYGIRADGFIPPVVFANGAVTELPMPADATMGAAIDINDSGRIVGYVATPTGTLGLSWASPTSQPVPTGLSLAFGISPTGDVAGVTAPPGCNSTEAAVVRNGVVEVLPTDLPCQDSTAIAINSAGVVVGDSVAADGRTMLTVWNAGAHTFLEPVAGFSSSSSAVHAVNEWGDVTGSTGTPTGPSMCWSQAMAWLPEGNIVLPSPAPYSGGTCDQSTAFGTNRNAQVVGVFSGVNSQQLPVLWNIDVDRQDPVVSISVDIDRIAPPNRRMVPVTFSGTIVDKTLASATFAVADEYGQIQPSGNVIVNASGAFSVTVQLEARFAGGDRDGRTYTMTVTATDQGGRVGSASAVSAVRVGPPSK